MLELTASSQLFSQNSVRGDELDYLFLIDLEEFENLTKDSLQEKLDKHQITSEYCGLSTYGDGTMVGVRTDVK